MEFNKELSNNAKIDIEKSNSEILNKGNMKRQIEILAPAGSYEGMRAAMNAGCDAVYIGGSSFGARAYANNPEEDILLRAIDEAHVRDKKLYLTVNTLLKEKEHTEELYQFLKKYYLQGLDAVIVQDVGVLRFIHRNFPGLDIHASTQTTLTMAEGANLFKDYGVTRLVTARELSLSEIKNIRNNTELEIETFVHGALCYCYSGQCLMSSMIGGRSGNRGRCAQPCRMPYQFYSGDKRLSSEQEKYLLSPKDINTLALIPELVEAGIDSFKIEGRMKRPEYAAAVSSMYRKYVDLYFELGKERYHKLLQSEDFEKDMILLQDVYSRGGFSEGYGKTYNGKRMMSLERPNHSGVYVGEVIESKVGQVAIALKEEVNAQDILEIILSDSNMQKKENIRKEGTLDKAEEGHEFTVKDPHPKGAILRTNAGKNQSRIKVGDPVYRTKNNLLINRLANEFLEKDRKLGVRGYLYAKVGERLSFQVSYKECTVTAYRDEVQAAQKQPMTKDKLAAPLEKTGDTLYYFKELVIESGENIFVPVAWLNDIRREALGMLQEAVAVSYRRSTDGEMDRSITKSSRKETVKTRGAIEAIFSAGNTPGVVVALQSEEQFEVALKYSEVDSLYVEYDTIDLGRIAGMAEAAKKAEKEFYLMLPHICRQTEYQRLKKELIEIIENENILGFIIKNFEEITLLQSLLEKVMYQKTLILNYNMYTYNREAKVFFQEQGITNFTAPVELNYQELKQLGISDSDLIVYGYLPLMVSAQCLFESTEGCRRCKSGNQEKAAHNGHLMDRLGKKFYVRTNCNGCYNIIYNGQALSLLKQEEEIRSLKPKNLRLDFSLEGSEEMNKILGAFIHLFRHGKKGVWEPTDYTTGHFKRGVE